MVPILCSIINCTLRPLHIKHLHVVVRPCRPTTNRHKQLPQGANYNWPADEISVCTKLITIDLKITKATLAVRGHKTMSHDAHQLIIHPTHHLVLCPMHKVTKC